MNDKSGLKVSYSINKFEIPYEWISEMCIFDGFETVWSSIHSDQVHLLPAHRMLTYSKITDPFPLRNGFLPFSRTVPYHS